METTKLLDGARRRLARAAPLLVAAACAVAGGAARAAGPEAANGPQFAPGSGAPGYGPWDGRKCQHSSTFDYVLQYLADGAKQNKRPVPQADPRLCAVAEAFVGWEPGIVPRPPLLAFASHWAGLPGNVNVPVVADFDEQDQRTVAERIVQSAAGAAALNAVHPLVGMATKRLGRTRLRISIVVMDLQVEFAPPVPRRLEKGQEAKVSGRLVGGVKNPKVFVSDAAGKLSKPEQPPGDAVQATLACGDRPGTIQVEIRAEYEGSSGLVAGFPVSCGESPPASIAIAGEAWPAEPEAVAQKVLAAVNAERSAAGVVPLKWDPAIAGVAHGIAEDIAAKGASGGGDVVERLKKEGISSALVLQSAAAERTFERASDRVLASPRDRATVLDPDATNVGVGTATAKDAQGIPVAYLVEVLIKELPPVDAAKVRQQLRDAVAQKRKDARTNAVAQDPTLDEVAQKFAGALAEAGGALSKEKAGELTFPLNKSFRTVTMISGAKQDALDFAEEAQATAAGKALGVGVAQGRHPVLGRNAVYVVLMVGTPRAGGEEPSAAPAKKKKAAPAKTR